MYFASMLQENSTSGAKFMLKNEFDLMSSREQRAMEILGSSQFASRLEAAIDEAVDENRVYARVQLGANLRDTQSFEEFRADMKLKGFFDVESGTFCFETDGDYEPSATIYLSKPTLVQKTGIILERVFN